MSLIRFDPRGAINADYGITTEQLRSLYPRLESLRQELVEVDPERHSQGQLADGHRSLDAGFYRMPQQQLEQYRLHRESSELGRIFGLANTVVDDIDAVVVLGIGGSHWGARALMDACCDPYHNELRRAARGSRPRMYFGGHNLDNDASQALLGRLHAGGYGDTPAEGRHAILAVSKSGETLETAIALRQFLNQLSRQLGVEAEKWLSRLLIPITGGCGKLSDLAKAIGCEQVFSVPEGVGGRFSVLSAVGLLPAALLGLDCMKLLEGAVAMNRHFEAAPPQENVVLQYVAVNHLLSQTRDKSIRVLSVWSAELESFGRWHDQLLAESNGKAGLGVTPLTTVNTRDLHGRHQQHQQGRNDKVLNNLIVEKYRTDPLSIGANELNQDSLNDLASKDLTEVMAAAIKVTNEALHADGRPTADIILPMIDTYFLGQLFQMLMIATVIEGRLLGINPYGQPGVDQYKVNLSTNLGRY